MLDWWLLTVFGFLIGILASMTGVGGGVFIVPILTFFYGFVVNAATGTSLATIIFTAIASTFNYAKQKRVYYKTGLILVTTRHREPTSGHGSQRSQKSVSLQ